MNFYFKSTALLSCGLALAIACIVSTDSSTSIAADAAKAKYDPAKEAAADIAKLDVGKKDWPQWGGWYAKNNTPDAIGVPTKWDVDSGENILWSTPLGSQTYGNPVVANGKVYVGTNNGAGYLKRFPSNVDLGCLLCIDEKTGKLLWQSSSRKLASGNVHDWALQGICCAPYVDGERLWYVTSRGEVLCLDTEGFHDGENDGPFEAEENENKDEADIVWSFDMMGKLGISQHNMCSCSVTVHGDILLVNTSNGVDDSEVDLPAPEAPSFFAMNKNTGKVIWTDNSPGENILHGQWSSPTVAVFEGQAQALFAGGDGWLYSFDPAGDGNGKSKLLWKFDCNPKETKWVLGGRGDRNNLIATPVVYDGAVYVAVGQDPENGEGIGHLWCIDPNKRGDVSPTLAVDKDDKPIPHRRFQAVEPTKGEKAIPNDNSAAIWHYSEVDRNGDGRMDFEEQMHRSCGTVCIKNDILFIADFAGLFHCLDAKTGKPYWSYDMFAAAWGSPLIVEDNVYIGDEDGDVTIFKVAKEEKMIAEINMGSAVYSTPIVANDTLFISNKSMLYAIGKKAK